MGVCVSSPAENESRKMHLEAEQVLKKAKRRMRRETKILLLGSGDSGKTTIMKQMRLITHSAFTYGELEAYRQLVFANLVTGMRALVECLPDVGMPIDRIPDIWAAYQEIEKAPDIKEGQPFPEEYLPHFKLLWAHPTIQRGILICRQFAIPDNVPYFYESLDRLFAPSYQPTHQDLVHVRARTTGIVETVFQIPNDLSRITLPDPNAIPIPAQSRHTRLQTKVQPAGPNHEDSNVPSMETTSRTTTAVGGDSATLEDARKALLKWQSSEMQEVRFVDVGGQKSQRRKWIHCFQDVTAILFLVALSGYDQCIIEEKTTNQMSDAMSIWGNICTMEWFKNCHFILFLNKEDLFSEKLESSPIRRYFPDYSGGSTDVEAAKDYFKRRFLRIAQKGTHQLLQECESSTRPNKTDNTFLSKRTVYPHFTTAVDISLIQRVMESVSHIILQSALQEADIL